MPKPRRTSAAAADNRPAFNRPPGAKARVTPAADDEITPTTPKRPSRPKAKESPATSPIKKTGGGRTRRNSDSPTKKSPSKDTSKHASSSSYNSTSQLLSAGSLAKLNAYNEKAGTEEKELQRKRKEKQYKNVGGQKRRKKNRDVSGVRMEEGRANEKNAFVRRRGGAASIREYMRRKGGNDKGSNRRCVVTLVVIVILLLVIFIPVGVLVIGKNSQQSSSRSGPSNSNLKNVDPNSIPAAAKGTDTDPFTWYDTTDFNVTYTGETVGGLSIMGLMSSWDDSKRPNNNVPVLSDRFAYGSMPIRGVNVGGWLSLEPFITPSLFNTFTASDNVVDEYTLTKKLGPGPAKALLEAHYATFVTEQTFIDIVDAGMDHVRIPFSYWAVTTYDGDPYVAKTSWRYLLRGIEWCRKHGLRVNLDLHAVPGSQNGWNHSGRLGTVGWLNGPDGALNAKRSLDLHSQLSIFFAQDRYKNVVTIYGLINEPKMMALPTQAVLDWNKQAIEIVRKNGIKQYLTFGDGFLGLNKWNDMFKNVDPALVMDTHQYVIFNNEQLAISHLNKINMACQGWGSMLSAAVNPSTGCVPYIFPLSVW
jgi:glucan 1,3-beta-glucosidase